MEKCESCSRTEEKYKNKYGYLTILLIHVCRATITNKKTPGKEEARHQLAKAANAMLNADGGKLLIHVDGQQKWDRDLEVLDEAIGKRFSSLLHDGCQYCDYFTREWLSNVKSFEYADDFLLFGITKINGVSTLDSKTKMRNDFENVTAPCAVIAAILQCYGDDETQHPSNIVPHTGIDDIPLHEDRATELKSFPPQAAGATVESVTNCIWNDLKLKHNITSMAKLPRGGRFCIGISETPYPGDYKTKTRQINGFQLRVDINELIQCLDNKLKTDMLVLTGRGAFREAPSDLIAVHVYPIQGTNKCVLSVNINHFNGIVFHDRAGPEVYTFENGEICLMSNDIWLQRLLSFSRQPISTRGLTHRSPNCPRKHL
ncbi:uncharacterized protein [Haliotis cracherodii]|uniref:uncharacterized protein n=1 Tax=Haliotis cracherodii TaxID=6455 RepID=UPI0039EA1C98